MLFLQSFDSVSLAVGFFILFLDTEICELLSLPCAVSQVQTRSFLDDLFINELMDIYLIRRPMCSSFTNSGLNPANHWEFAAVSTSWDKKQEIKKKEEISKK